MRAVTGSLVLTTFCVLGSGCTPTGGAADAGGAPDQSVAMDLATAADMAMPRDLTVPPDLTAPPDLAPAKVSLPTNCPASATLAEVYAVFQTSCSANSGCHGANSIHFSALNAAELKTKWVNVDAHQPPMPMPYVTPNNVDRSYVLYKLRNEQAKVSYNGGGYMPQGAAMLTDADVCKFVAWIRSGAP